MHFNEGMKKHVSTQTFPFPPFLVLSNSFASIFHFIHVDALSVDDAKAIFRVDYRSTGIKSRPQKVEQMVLNFNVISVFHTFRTLDRIWMHCMITWALYTQVRTAFSIRYVNWTELCLFAFKVCGHPHSGAQKNRMAPWFSTTILSEPD